MVTIRRFDKGYSRRRFLREMELGVIAGGVLAPLWSAFAGEGDISKVYPDELLSIELYTKSRIKPGDVIDKDNVEHVWELLDPIKRKQIVEMGRKLTVKDSTRDLAKLMPIPYLEATVRNKGQARFNDKGNVVDAGGNPWIGGNPFPEPKNALEAFAAQTLSWGRHDGVVYAFKADALNTSGEVKYRYEGVWAELSPVARTVMEPRPYWPGHKDILRYQSVAFTSPSESAGTAFLNIWPYDQNTFPDLYGYIPHYGRIRQFPTDQRFEPLVPGSELYLSDAWAAGDPLHTWGNFKVIDRKPMLGAVAGAWSGDHPNWEREAHGGPNGSTFFHTTVELVPEVLIVEAEPTGFPRAPVGKKRVWFDIRTGLPIAMNSYDRKGQLFRMFDGAYGVYENAQQTVMAGKHPYWSWGHAHGFNLQTGSMTRLEQVKEVAGGHQMVVNDESIYHQYLTRTALSRIG